MTYRYLANKLKDESIMAGTNTAGENVIVQRVASDCILFITSQDNGWLRKNYYYEDGSTEETYEK